MRLKFYGTWGSIPVCNAGFQQFGWNTTCLQITFTDTNRVAINDAGTGIRNLGRDLRAMGHKQDQIFIAFTHFHWDHIQGFPFFPQAYDPGQKIDQRLVELARGADLLVHDAQYIAEELQKRGGWRHSSFDQAMQVAERAGVKRLALTHHEPEHDDEFLQRMENLCRERFPDVVLAREGIEIQL